MKHGDLRTAAKDRRSEAGVEEDVESPVDGGKGKHGLLPQESERPVDCADGLRHVGEVAWAGTRSAPVSRLVKTKY